jgi:hypothetical protein
MTLNFTDLEDFTINIDLFFNACFISMYHWKKKINTPKMINRSWNLSFQLNLCHWKRLRSHIKVKTPRVVKVIPYNSVPGIALVFDIIECRSVCFNNIKHCCRNKISSPWVFYQWHHIPDNLIKLCQYLMKEVCPKLQFFNGYHKEWWCIL